MPLHRRRVVSSASAAACRAQDSCRHPHALAQPLHVGFPLAFLVANVAHLPSPPVTSIIILTTCVQRLEQRHQAGAVKQEHNEAHCRDHDYTGDIALGGECRDYVQVQPQKHCRHD